MTTTILTKTTTTGQTITVDMDRLGRLTARCGHEIVGTGNVIRHDAYVKGIHIAGRIGAAAFTADEVATIKAAQPKASQATIDAWHDATPSHHPRETRPEWYEQDAEEIGR